MAEASSNDRKEVLRERVKKAKEILTLKRHREDIVNDDRIQSFINSVGTRVTRCLVVFEGFNGKQGKQYFWERKRDGTTLTEEDEECEYKIGRRCETYVLARLELYLLQERINGNQNQNNREQIENQNVKSLTTDIKNMDI